MLISSECYLISFALLGLCIGSFINVVVYRLPIMMNITPATETKSNINLLWPGSACPHCSQPLSARHLVPVLSWLCQRGRCHSCKHPISARYPLVELGCTILFLLISWHWPTLQIALPLCLFSATLLTLSLIDIDHLLLPDVLTLPLLWCGLIWNTLYHYVSPPSALFGAVFGYGVLWLIYHLYRLFTQREGLGYGDFKLLAALGAWLGVAALPTIILIAALLSLIFLILRGKNYHAPLPFGPGLAAAALITLLIPIQSII
ncbi:prepilin peptidase [Serratia quinivorans]|uniref:prepilin peptidase n=1 Tax=Serratia quinivorans TaxID=137545 RepID=UPI00217AC57B|nr:A24 family peptidase [Serratia quinivorans]CAI1012213.1 Pectic enzymes secretion protein outO [Serratia quinivorans]CAI1812454.1 Pectic enzymes secretion protein outO [Serratia quinivorans]